MITQDSTQATPKVIIGQYYQAPLKNYMNQDCELWQSVYLGDYQRDVLFRRQLYSYTWVICILLSTLLLIIDRN
jgi:hypothetical protein